MSRLHRYDRAFRYVRNIAQPHCESYTQFCLRTDVLVEAINKAKKYDDKETPKKPYFLNYGGFKIGNWHCSNCDGIIDDGDRYCKHCGYIQDLGDEDE